jgi:hypothetical protein
VITSGAVSGGTAAPWSGGWLGMKRRKVERERKKEKERERRY